MTDKPQIEELDEATCWANLEAKRLGRLAVSVSNRPDVFPVNYVVDGKAIVVQTAPGFKLAAAVLGSGVAFEVDDIDEASHSGWSVVIHGTAAEVEKLEDLLEAEDLDIEPWAAGAKNHFIRIDVDEITGRRIPPVT
ncbi:MAG: pyridoxamine 5'-phosphate oxidase family protein [Actinomycetota bacterium]